MSKEAYRVDVHHHITPPFYLEALAGIGVTTLAKGMDIPLPKWSPDSALSMMDKHGIAVSMTSAGINSYEGLDAATRLAMERGNALELFPRFRSEIV